MAGRSPEPHAVRGPRHDLGIHGPRLTFDEAVSAFATSYADQVARDYDALVNAVASGLVTATPNA